MDHVAALLAGLGQLAPGGDLVVEGQPGHQGIFRQGGGYLPEDLLGHQAVIVDGGLGEAADHILDGLDIGAGEAYIRTGRSHLPEEDLLLMGRT